MRDSGCRRTHPRGQHTDYMSAALHHILPAVNPGSASTQAAMLRSVRDNAVPEVVRDVRRPDSLFPPPFRAVMPFHTPSPPTTLLLGVDPPPAM
ncbi:hypothetical protein Landi51_10284 [Colletotrichum acutatum]